MAYSADLRNKALNYYEQCKNISRLQRMVGSIVDIALDRVYSVDSIGTVTRLLATYNLTALPVLDEAGRLVGAVSVDDVLDHLMPDDWREADEAVTDEMIERNANA